MGSANTLINVHAGRNQGDGMNSSDDQAAAKPAPQYAEEVLCANWNPLALLVVEPVKHAVARAVDGSEAEAFLARLYRCQQA
jgi:hypothetical protein